MANNEVSPFGYEFVTEEGAVTELNIIERDLSKDTYTILYNLYISVNTALGSQSGTQKAKVDPKLLWKSSTMEEKPWKRST